MSVARKLLVILLFVALVPVGVAIVSALRVHQEAFDAQLTELHRRTAQYGAHSVQSWLDGARGTIGALATRVVPWSDLNEEERRGAVWLVYRQLDDAAAVTLLDEKGSAFGETAWLSEVPEGGEPHPLATVSLLHAFGRSIPFAASRAGGFALGEPFGVDGQPPMIALAFSVDGRTTAEPWVLAVALSLRGICADLTGASPPGVTTRVVDGAGRALCPPDGALGLPDESLRARLISRASHYLDRHGTEMFAQSAPAPLGWTIIAEQPALAAFASSRRMRAQSLFWVGLGVVVAVVAGLALTQGIRRPLDALTAGAEAVADGRFDHRVGVTGRDEFGALARTFNRMSGEIQRKDAEIRAWNAELLARVELRTTELEETQEQLLQSRKLAAVASLGAGVAHEINNPLTGVLGMTQLLMSRLPAGARERELLATVESEALRIRDIVERMLALSQDGGDVGFAPVDVADLLDSALRATSPRIEAACVTVVVDVAPGMPAVLGSASQLQQALVQLVDNSIKAMPTGGTLRLSAGADRPDLVTISVADTGRGMPQEVLDKVFEPFFTMKEDWRGQGLGLAIAFRIIDAHHGRIRAQSRPDQGTTMTISLPAAPRSAHLA